MKIQTYPPGYDTGEEQVTLSDLQSHARTLLAVVERMEHGKTCPAVDPKPVRGEFFTEWKLGPCDPRVCPRGELRRGLEVMTGLKEMAK